ncbi:MAG: leucine-rich repeat protein [Clostridia bacterium]|nr:leucine-rich repeat protein [Clostridia bacterium]
MKHLFKKGVAFLLAILCALNLTVVSFAEDLSDSGTCGEGVNWSYDKMSKELSIFGNGAIDDNYTGWDSLMFRVKSIVISQGITSIGNRAFDYFMFLENVSIAQSVNSIGANAFKYCRSLKSIEIPDGVTFIGPCAFRGCSSLFEIVIPNSVTDIGIFAFSKCKSVKSVDIPDSMSKIRLGTFKNCSSLKELTLTYSLEKVAFGSFVGCGEIDTVNYTGTQEQWDKVSAEFSGLDKSKVTAGCIQYSGLCGEKVEWSYDEEHKALAISGEGRIKDDYCGWENLKNTIEYVKVEDGVTSIGKNAFSDFSNLKEIYLGESVSVISEQAFKGCSNLAIVTVLSDTLTFSNAFSDNDLRLHFITKLNSQAQTALVADGYKTVRFHLGNQLNGELKLLFEDEIVIYDDLSYNYILNFINEMKVSDFHFSSLSYSFTQWPDDLDSEISSYIKDGVLRNECIRVSSKEITGVATDESSGDSELDDDFITDEGNGDISFVDSPYMDEFYQANVVIMWLINKLKKCFL